MQERFLRLTQKKKSAGGPNGRLRLTFLFEMAS